MTIPGIGENVAATGDLDITDDLTISGANAITTIIDGAGLDRVLHIVAGSVTLSSVTVRGGHGVPGDGGGIYNAGTLTLNSSSVSGNTSPIEGGGIYNNAGAVTLDNSTVSGNITAGIYTVGTLTLNSSTVSGNTEAGIWNFGTATIKNSIVANNAGEDCRLTGTFTSLGHNLDSDGTCNLTGPGDLCPPPLTDQRGVARPQGAACDIGAYEVECATGGQSVDLTVPSAAAVLGVGTGTPVTVDNPLAINYSVQGCFGEEMFLIAVVNAPPIVLSPSYYDGTTWVPVPTPLSLMTPSLAGGPETSNGTHTLFSGGLPPGTYDLFLVCDLFVNGRLDVPAPSCLSGAFDHLPLTVQ